MTLREKRKTKNCFLEKTLTSSHDHNQHLVVQEKIQMETKSQQSRAEQGRAEQRGPAARCVWSSGNLFAPDCREGGRAQAGGCRVTFDLNTPTGREPSRPSDITAGERGGVEEEEEAEEGGWFTNHLCLCMLSDRRTGWSPRMDATHPNSTLKLSSYHVFLL